MTWQDFSNDDGESNEIREVERRRSVDKPLSRNQIQVSYKLVSLSPKNKIKVYKVANLYSHACLMTLLKWAKSERRSLFLPVHHYTTNFTKKIKYIPTQHKWRAKSIKQKSHKCACSKMWQHVLLCCWVRDSADYKRTVFIGCGWDLVPFESLCCLMFHAGFIKKHLGLKIS